MKILANLVVLLCLACFPESLLALTMTTYAEQSWVPPIIPISVIEQSSATSGIIQSEVSYGGLNASAIASSNGTLQVSALSSGSFDIYIDNHARATWSDTITNHTGTALNMKYDFLINGLLSVALYPYEHISRSSYSIDIYSEGVSWGSSASLIATEPELTTEGPLLVIAQPTIGGADIGVAGLATYVINNYTNSLSLATLLPGDSIFLKVVVSASQFSCEQLQGYGSSILSLSGNYRFTPTEAPEPATMFLFGTGLAGLVGSRLRRKKK